MPQDRTEPARLRSPQRQVAADDSDDIKVSTLSGRFGEVNESVGLKSTHLFLVVVKKELVL
jgi:hypothetical protein